MLLPARDLLGSAMIRRACALAGIFALFLQGSSGGHMLLVEHTRCAEHGELVHDGKAHHHEGASHAHSSLAAFQGASEEASDEAHEHCALTVDRRDALAVIAEAQSSAPVVEREPLFTFTRQVVPFETGRFRIAPKNSPPA